MYLTFTEYVSFGGTLDETTFNQYEFKARKAIDAVTANRVKEHMAVISEAVKRCVFELIKIEYLYDSSVDSISHSGQGGGAVGLLSSFTNDGYTETFATGSLSLGEFVALMRTSTDTTERSIIKSCLAYEYDDEHTPLLYRGVYK